MGREIGLRVLGPVRVQVDETSLVPATPQLRLLTGLMALRIGQVVPVDELIDSIWETDPPRSARASLQALVTKLRQLLKQVPGAALPRCGDGYQLVLEPDLVDAHRFRALSRSARQLAGPAAIARFDAALALWRGPVLADAADTARIRAIRDGLAEERLSVRQDRLACMLACGQERAVAAELPAALASHPLNERLAGMLMTTLYRSGQRADALGVFRQIRSRLAAELGVEPGPDLQRLHRRMLAGDVDLAGPGRAAPARPDDAGPAHSATPVTLQPRPVPRQLPAAPAQFVGRAAELGRLNELVHLATEPGGEAVVRVITGPAGVGKSALATTWAHRAAAHFRGGQLYVDLEGFGPAARPVRPEQALGGLLEALGVAPAELPDSVEARAALYRSLLAGQGVLVVLDNARDAEQVLPLLPGCSRCAVVVTSRSNLDGLVATVGARVMCVDVLSEAESRELIVRRLSAARVLAEPQAVADLARLCAGLPLALAIATARVAARPSFGLTGLSAELTTEHARLDALETSDTTSSVREVFSWSYRELNQGAARMFRLLGLHPGPDISAAAAAGLAGQPEPEARRALAELTASHLLAEPVPGRFTGHDLLRAYAAEQARAGEGEAERGRAMDRLIDHYLHTADTAAHLVYPARDPLDLGPSQPGSAPGRLPSQAAALGWLGAEHQVLLAVTDAAALTGHDVKAWQLSAALTDYLNREGHWHDLATVGRTALAAAQRAGDGQGQAHARSGLGIACLRAGSYEAARSHLLRAIALFRRAGATTWRARCQLTLGTVLDQEGRPAKARVQAEEALSLYRELGHRAGEAHALANLGWHLAILGAYPAAVSCCRQAVDLHRELGNPLGEAHAWDHLGYAQHQLGEDAAAMVCYCRALDLLQEVSDRSEQASVLARLGDAYRAVGDHRKARATWRQALAILDDLRDPGAGLVRSKLGGQAVPALPSVS